MHLNCLDNLQTERSGLTVEKRLEKAKSPRLFTSYALLKLFNLFLLPLKYEKVVEYSIHKSFNLIAIMYLIEMIIKSIKNTYG